MGMYDEVICEYPLPRDTESSVREFQTKSLYRLLDRFTITRKGRLIHHWARYERQEQEGEDLFRFRMVAVEHKEIDMEFHGDMWLTGGEDHPGDYIARFTHGILEWIRPIETFSKEQQELIDSRSLHEH